MTTKRTFPPPHSSPPAKHGKEKKKDNTPPDLFKIEDQLDTFLVPLFEEDSYSNAVRDSDPKKPVAPTEVRNSNPKKPVDSELNSPLRSEGTNCSEKETETADLDKPYRQKKLSK
ncbi:hypothetical protein FQA39_LY16721 [Lamprigera yunnana]|nr:hypothetical protein FQA39_LY16721 [Lamprigera yunnana]